MVNFKLKIIIILIYFSNIFKFFNFSKIFFFVFISNYYVVDAGYPNTRGFSRPYNNCRYHIQDFHHGNGLRDKEDLFNFYHSSLRNAIERYFGVLKARFPILMERAPCPFSTQVYIVVASMALRNFIHQEVIIDNLFIKYDIEGVTSDDKNNYDKDDVVI